MLDQIGNAAHGGADDAEPAGHRLDDADRRVVHAGGVQEHVAFGQDRRHGRLRHRADELHAIPHSQPLGLGPVCAPAIRRPGRDRPSGARRRESRREARRRRAARARGRRSRESCRSQTSLGPGASRRRKGYRSISRGFGTSRMSSRNLRSSSPQETGGARDHVAPRGPGRGPGAATAGRRPGGCRRAASDSTACRAAVAPSTPARPRRKRGRCTPPRERPRSRAVATEWCAGCRGDGEPGRAPAMSSRRTSPRETAARRGPRRRRALFRSPERKLPTRRTDPLTPAPDDRPLRGRGRRLRRSSRTPASGPKWRRNRSWKARPSRTRSSGDSRRPITSPPPAPPDRGAARDARSPRP